MDSLRVKLETRAGENFGILGKNSFVVANLDSARQNQRENLAGISLRLEQARHDDVGVEHDFHFRRRARRLAAISASMSDMEKPDVPLTTAACWSAACACSARTLRTSARVDSTDADAMRSNTAMGWPLEVMTKSSLLADLSHCFVGFFFNSLTDIVLMLVTVVRKAVWSKPVLPTADAALNDQMDALVPQFAAANAKFVEDYNNARIIVDSGGGKAKAKTPTPKPPTP